MGEKSAEQLKCEFYCNLGMGGQTLCVSPFQYESLWVVDDRVILIGVNTFGGAGRVFNSH